jgi:AcrR family transcriptional regulator
MRIGNTAQARRRRETPALIETAYRLFKQEGLHATGTDRIIAEATVAKMTAYRHFPSKDGLIVEVLDWCPMRGRQHSCRIGLRFPASD